jgi:hypothetical protein
MKKLLALSLYASCFPPAGTEPTRSVGVDYVRVTRHPVVQSIR